MRMLFEGAFWVVVIVCIGLIVYTIINAINVSKRNKATEEAARKIFLAKIEKDIEIRKQSDGCASEPKSEDVDELQEMVVEKESTIAESELEENTSGKNLRDFFVP